jgi:cardiolipin synthase
MKIPNFDSAALFKTLWGLPVWSKYPVWIWVLIVVALLCLFYVFINLFTAFADNTPLPTTDSNLSLSDPLVFEQTLASAVNSQVEEGSPIRILTNGKEFLPDLLGEIKNAKQSIYITDYIWDNGDFGNTLFKTLIKKAQEGIAVRVLLDGMSGRKANKDLIQTLRELGGKVEQFRPVTWWNITRIDRRTHVRDFVIDNKIAYLGGIAISDNWLGDATSSTSWHDFMFKTDGRLAERSSAVFSTMWSLTTGEMLTATPSSKTLGSDLTKSTQFVSLFSQPSADLSSNMQHFIWLSIMASRKSIHLENPYLLPSKFLMDALTTKAKDGLDVELIVPGTNTDTIYTRWASQSFYTELLKAGVKIYEYQPSRIHAKMMTMDGTWSVIGSANLDNRSSEINLEYIIGVHDPVFASDLEAKFAEDKGRSKEVTSKYWEEKSLLWWPLQHLSRLFIHQY